MRKMAVSVSPGEAADVGGDVEFGGDVAAFGKAVHVPLESGLKAEFVEQRRDAAGRRRCEFRG